MFYANDTADRLLRPSELPELSAELGQDEAIKALHFGSISLVMEPGATALEQLMWRESRRRIISLDPNVRPDLIANKVVYRRRFENWLQLVDIVKLSRADFEFHYPGETAETIIQGWLNRGPGLCILTSGAAGSTAYAAGGSSASTPTPRVNVADTVGAGDTYMAAILSFLRQQAMLDNHEKIRDLTPKKLADCLTHAGRAAALNCTRQGADPPTKRELERIYG